MSPLTYLWNRTPLWARALIIITTLTAISIAAGLASIALDAH